MIYNMIFTLLMFLAITTAVFVENASGGPLGLEGKSSSRTKRYNFNFGHGVAIGQGNNNQFGYATNFHRGMGAGIRTPDGIYHGLGSQSGSYSNAFGTGFGAPNSFATGGSRIRPNGASGFTKVGQGGRGNAYAHDYSKNIAVPLPNGSTFLSNLKVKDENNEEIPEINTETN